jgi:hypothetical protein
MTIVTIHAGVDNFGLILRGRPEMIVLPIPTKTGVGRGRQNKYTPVNNTKNYKQQNITTN